MMTNEWIAALADKTQDCDERILTLIYDHYAEFHGSDTPLSKEYYKAIRDQIAHLDSAEQDAIVDLVNQLCSAHENAAFVEGVKTGVRLLCELMA